MPFKQYKFYFIPTFLFLGPVLEIGGEDFWGRGIEGKIEKSIFFKRVSL